MEEWSNILPQIIHDLCGRIPRLIKAVLEAFVGPFPYCVFNSNIMLQFLLYEYALCIVNNRK